MNLVVTLHIIRTNPLQTKTSKEGSSHLHNQGRFIPSTQPQQSSSKEGSKENTILNGPAINRDKSAQGHPSRSTGKQAARISPLQHPLHKLEDHHRLPQSLNQVQAHQDPPECNDTNGSTRAPTNSKGPGATKSKKASTNTSPATQPLESTKTLLYVLNVAKVATGAKTVHIIIFVIFLQG